MNIQHLLHQAQQKITLLEAEILLAFVLQKSQSHLRAFSEKDVDYECVEQFKHLVGRRLQGEPIAYLVSKKEFWSLDLKVTPEVLIPRPDTELLVELILQHFPSQSKINVADLGTGSGAIALALANERPAWNIIAVDISAMALEIAQHNAKALGINNIQWQCANWCEQLPDHYFHIIVSNPPYIAVKDPHLVALQHEPSLALIAADNGLHAFKTITCQAKQKLLPEGILYFEHGYNQASAVQNIFTIHGFQNIKTYTDLNGHERVTKAKV